MEEEACQLQRQLNGIYHKCLVSEEDKKIIEADPEGGVVCCGVLWCGVLWCAVVCCGVVCCSVVC